jgi:hypothetical protein
MNWIPKNKRTGRQYPAISDQEKREMEADKLIGPKYVFLPVNEKQEKPAPEPKEAKKTKNEQYPTNE